MAKNRIAQLRKSRGLTQRALAELVGTSQQQIQRIEAGIHGVRLELATKIAAALGGELSEIFPSLGTVERRGLAGSRYINQNSKLAAVGLDPDPNHWTVRFFANDGRVFDYEIPSAEKDRLEIIFGRVGSGIVAFETTLRWVAVNQGKIAATQFLFDHGVSSKEVEEEGLKLKLHLVGAKQPIIFGVERDTCLHDADEEGSSSQLQSLFLHLEMNLEDEIVSFYDEDRERVYIKPTEILIIEVPTVCCVPALWDAEIEGLTEDDTSQNVLAHSVKAQR
jgi:transcriptional regulator with XRE-family HTH domain